MIYLDNYYHLFDVAIRNIKTPKQQDEMSNIAANRGR